MAKSVFLPRAADPEIHDRGQDGRLVSAILLWCPGQRRDMPTKGGLDRAAQLDTSERDPLEPGI